MKPKKALKALRELKELRIDEIHKDSPYRTIDELLPMIQKDEVIQFIDRQTIKLRG